MANLAFRMELSGSLRVFMKAKKQTTTAEYLHWIFCLKNQGVLI
jgi:hypothetical protein